MDTYDDISFDFEKPPAAASLRECHCTILPEPDETSHVEVCQPCRERVVRMAESFLSEPGRG